MDLNSESNMDTINDMFGEFLIYNDQEKIQPGKSKEYYIGKAEYI